MKTIIISEEMEQKLFQYLIKEAICDGDVRLEVFNYLNNNFQPYAPTIINNDGKQSDNYLVLWLDQKTKQIFQTITLEKLFWMVQDEFKGIKDDKKERDEFLWETIKAWYGNKYNPKTGNIFK